MIARSGRRDPLAPREASGADVDTAAYRTTRPHLLRVRLSALAGSAVSRMIAASGPCLLETSRRRPAIRQHSLHEDGAALPFIDKYELGEYERYCTAHVPMSVNGAGLD
jgi:hypothetical protein